MPGVVGEIEPGLVAEVGADGALVERCNVRARAVIHHERLAVLIDHLGVAEPRAERGGVGA